MIVDSGEVWWFDLPGVGRKPGVVCSRRTVNLSVLPVIARITTVDRERSLPTTVALDDGEVDALGQRSWILAHDLFLAGPGTPLLDRAGRLGPARLVELRRALGWTFGLS